MLLRSDLNGSTAPSGLTPVPPAEYAAVPDLSTAAILVRACELNGPCSQPVRAVWFEACLYIARVFPAGIVLRYAFLYFGR
jgi:hypothetical protein